MEYMLSPPPLLAAGQVVYCEGGCEPSGVPDGQAGCAGPGCGVRAGGAPTVGCGYDNTGGSSPGGGVMISVCRRLEEPRPELDIDLNPGESESRGRVPGLGSRTQVQVTGG